MKSDSPNIRISFKKTHPDAILPVANNTDPMIGDSGYDMFSVENVTIPARGAAVVPIGLTLAYVTPGFWFRIEPRSGLGFKHGIQPHLGIIDNMYRGDLGVKLYNFSDKDYEVNTHDRVAQFVVYQLLQADLDLVEEIDETSRGSSGFGSSGR